MDEKLRELKKQMTIDLLNSFLGGESGSGYYSTKLVLNKNHESNVYSTLCKQLKGCDEFLFNVAFITDDGLIMLKHTLEEVKCKGRIITSDYLMFNNPKTFEELLKLKDKDVDIRIYSKDNFHAKGYIFRSGDQYKALIGSSNLTGNALKKNTEWNVLTSSLGDGSFINEIINEFVDEWDNDTVALDKAWIEEYKKKYEINRKYVEKTDSFILDINVPRPNKMQQEALTNLDTLRKQGERKALLISATGTGKTFLSAFDAYNYDPKKVLFIAHRGKLLNDASKTFKKVFGDIPSSIYKGQNKDKDARLIFASIQTLAKEDNLKTFDVDEFDYIVVDEAHHTCGSTYKRVLDYFKPKFLLGMTATPERMDGGDIFAYYDHNVAYEIRLNDALEYELLCPFHYFGINDFTIDGEESDALDFNKLVNNKRVELVMEKAQYYGYSGEKVKGLIFVSRVDEAKKLSLLFNEKGWKTAVLSGEDSEDERERIIESLESDNGLDYIISVDVLNEGVDIPSVNQIIMLRPTESTIIFVQQLGRGLRKVDNKKYVVVLDFIANYQKNYLIPIALSGDKSYQKQKYREFMTELDVITPSVTTIEFDEVVKERIFKQINKATIGGKTRIFNEYKQLKNMLGRIPTYDDFLNYDTINMDLLCSEFNSYYSFLLDRKEVDAYFNETEKAYLDFVSKEFINGMRLSEVEAIADLINGDVGNYSGNCKRILDGSFLSNDDVKRYSGVTFLDEKGNITRSFNECLKNLKFKKELLDIITYIRKVNKRDYPVYYKDSDLVLYKTYTRKDVCRLLNWPINMNPQNIGGYFYDEISNTMAVYVTYNKDLNTTSASLMYEDRFIDKKHIVCMSKNNRSLSSPEALRFINYDGAMKVHLFINKIKGDSFYYLGEITCAKDKIEEKYTNEGKKILEFHYELDTPVKDSIYDYLTTRIVDTE